MDPSSKERRRALEAIRQLSRRAPLNSGQRERLVDASRTLRSLRPPMTHGERRKIFSAIGEIANVTLEILDNKASR